MIFEENSTVRKVNNVTTYFSDICGTIKTKKTLVSFTICFIRHPSISVVYG